MKILVIGGNGFLGGAIARCLSVAGHEISVVSRTVPTTKSFSFYSIDLFEVQEVRELIKVVKPDVVIQSAWITGKSDYRNSPLNPRYHSATKSLMLNCAELGVTHFIGIGSCAEYGVTNFSCNSGLSQLLPTDSYSKEKLETFNSLMKIANFTGLNFTWARVFQPYGQGQEEKRLLPTLIRCARTREKFFIEHPNTVSDWIQKSDVADALKFIVEENIYGPLDIGTGEGTSNLDLARLVEIHTGKKIDLVVADTESEPYGLVMDQFSPLRMLGWRNSKRLEIGLQEMLDEF